MRRVAERDFRKHKPKPGHGLDPPPRILRLINTSAQDKEKAKVTFKEVLRVRKAISILLLVFGCFVGTASAQTGSIVITATSTPASITVDRNCNYVVIQENSATPTNAFTVTLPGQSTGVTYQAGYRFVFTAGPSGFNKGQTIGTISIASGSVQFIGIESDQTPTIPASARGLYFQDGGTPIGTADTINCSGCSISGTTATIVGGGSGCIPGGSAGALQKNNSGACAAAALVDNAGTITASEPVYCNNLGNVRCIDPTNLAGWSGSDAGAWINSARTDCGTQDCSIKIAPGTYSVSTPITFTHNTALLCPGPATFTGTSFLNWLPATGTMITASGGVTFMLEGCRLEAPNNTGSVALQLGRVIYKTVVENFRINGFTGGIRVTGDGVSLTSTGVDIENGYISGFCGTGSYAINADHVGDITVNRVQAYSTVDCATSIPMILDTGVGGAWLTDSTFEQGLHAGIIRNTNQGGSYGSAPAAIFPKAITWDTTPGGDTLLFDSTLGTSDIRFYCDSCWFAGAGTNTAGSVVTSTAIGANIEGGSDIHFVGGASRVNASWGFDLNSSGSDFTVDAVNVHSNNQGNTAAIGGILVTGNPASWSILNTHSGNIVETGGHQQYGADISTASNTGYICNNDFASNVINQYKLSPFTTLSTNPNICGTGAGLIPWGPLQIARNGSPSNPSSGFDLLNFDTSDIFGPLTSAGAFAGGKFGSLNDQGLTVSLPVCTDASKILTSTCTALIPISDFNVTGTPSSSTFLRGDGSWQTVSGAFSGGSGSSFQDVTETAAPANPSAGVDRLWLDSTSHLLACHTSAGASCMPSGGSGTVTGVTLQGTANQITVSGTCNITTSGTCTFSLPNTVLLGTDASANGFIGVSNGSVGGAHTLWGSAATTTNTILGFATAPTTGDLIDCVTASTTCTLTDAGILAANLVTAASNFTNADLVQAAGANKTTSDSGIATANVVTAAANYTNGDLVQAAGANKTTSDSGIATANVVTQSSNAAANQICAYTGANKICIPTTTLPTAAFPALTGDVANSAGSLSTTIANGAVTGAKMANNTVTATQLAAQYSKGQCTEVFGGSGTSFAMQSGDDAISNNTCFNDSGVTRTITAVKCRSDNAANTTVLTPTMGSAGTGTAILTGTLTCGNSYAYSSSGTVSSSSWTTGTGIDAGMSTVGNATSIALLVEYTY